MLAFVVGLWRACYTASRRAKLDTAYPITPETILDLGVWLMLGIVVGARILFVLLDLGDYRANPLSMFEVWEGGLSFHGGFLGVLIVLAIFSRVKAIPFLALADIITPSAMIGYAIGRIGCFLNGCCYGAPTSLPWGVRFFDDGRWTVPSHPTQLYSAFMSIIFFYILTRFESRQKYAGQIAFWYVLFSAIERFVMEIWRAGVTSTRVSPGMTDVQWLCVIMAIVAVTTLYILRRRSESTGADNGSRGRELNGKLARSRR